jgi:hypothetical protein
LQVVEKNFLLFKTASPFLSLQGTAGHLGLEMKKIVIKSDAPFLNRRWLLPAKIFLTDKITDEVFKW